MLKLGQVFRTVHLCKLEKGLARVTVPSVKALSAQAQAANIVWPMEQYFYNPGGRRYLGTTQ